MGSLLSPCKPYRNVGDKSERGVILQAWDVNDESMHILTPLSAADRKKVASVQFGDIKVHPDGVEESLVPESAPRGNRNEACHFS